ncbi:hypothetical protein AC579_9856 [Pseudocercospora musae]|uniref:F-box domain-containing protein n=1 Tax=Pseudocercospora musae TaxID=113226 RepID=A0A139I815_9PEZI|nr:hypothetical protein AC579_9856 [Pseudocercospora musae]
MSNSPLLLLPEELVATISEFVPAESLLNFALTCKELQRVAENRLRQNQNYAREYTIQHDRLPLNVPTLLDLALENPEPLWHVRAFESWGLRPGWAKYRSWFHREWARDGWAEDADWLDEDLSYPDISEDFFSPEQYDAFRNILCKTLNLDHERTKFWMEKIREGWDEPLKGMLFALLPRLDRLNFMAYDSWQGEDFHDEHPLKFLCETIDAVKVRPELAWPPGLQSLRMVSVCTSTTLRHPHDAYYAPPSEIAPLFRLPNIKILNLTLLGYTDDPNDDFDLPPRSSTVEELAFSCCSITLQAMVKFLMAPMRLRKFLSAASSIGGDDDCEVFRVLQKRQGDQLEELSVSMYTNSYPPQSIEKFSKLFPRLKVLEQVKITELMPAKVASERDDWLAQVLPCSLEKLQLVYTSPVGVDITVMAEKGEILRAIADVVEDDRFHNLKEICLFHVSKQWNDERTEAEDLDAINGDDWDSEAIHRILAQGVETHLLDKRGKLMSSSEHFGMHLDGNSGLVEAESDARPREQRQ